MDPYLKKIQEDVDRMNKTFDKSGYEEEEETPNAEETFTEEETSDESSSTEAPSTEAPATAAPSTDAPVDDEPDEKDKLINDLRAKLAEKESTSPPAEATTKPDELTIEDQDFLGDLDPEDLSSDPAEFNKLLNKIYKQAVTDTYKTLGGKIPELVKVNYDTMNTLQKMTENFYAENDDLKPFSKVVATVFNETLAATPDKSFDEIMKELGPEVRNRLGLKKEVSAKTKPDEDKPPKLPRKSGKPGRSTDNPKPDPLRAELDEMLNTLGR